MRKVAQADYRICLGNIEFHYFAGFSGGAKAIMPGVSSYQAIQANHKFMVNGAACAGKIEEILFEKILKKQLKYVVLILYLMLY